MHFRAPGCRSEMRQVFLGGGVHFLAVAEKKVIRGV